MEHDFRARGEAADLLYNIARYDEAETAYLELYRDLRAAGPVDLFLAGKIALGLLLTWIEKGEPQRAFELWTARPADDLGEGVFAIEHGRLSRADFMCYQVASAFLHSLARDDVAAATRAINVRMQAVCDYAREADPDLLPVAIKDWKQFLVSLHGAVVEHDDAQPVMREVARYARPIPVDGVDFPPPAPWTLS